MDRGLFAVTYVGLPISAGGAHGMGRTTPRRAFELTMAFLRECTELSEPLVFKLRTPRVTPEVPPNPEADDLRAALFGSAQQITVPVDRVDDALSFLEQIRPQPIDNPYRMPRHGLRVEGGFRLLSPLTGAPMPDQDPKAFGDVQYVWPQSLGTSGFALTLDNSAALSINLCVPNIEGQELRSLVSWLQVHLPVRLSDKHWKLWSPTKAGSFTGRRMANPLLSDREQMSRT